MMGLIYLLSHPCCHVSAVGVAANPPFCLPPPPDAVTVSTLLSTSTTSSSPFAKPRNHVELDVKVIYHL